jgi:hypothetical protein
MCRNEKIGRVAYASPADCLAAHRYGPERAIPLIRFLPHDDHATHSRV